MVITVHDPKTVLILVDLQKGIVAYSAAHPANEVVRHAAALADAFRRHDLPVVPVNVAGGAPGRTKKTFSSRAFPADWTDLVPELNQQPKDHTITKRTWGAFTNTGLDEYLKKLGVTQVVIARDRNEHWRRINCASGARTRV
jgi:nicotinamidase-related amidase